MNKNYIVAVTAFRAGDTPSLKMFRVQAEGKGNAMAIGEELMTEKLRAALRRGTVQDFEFIIEAMEVQE